MPSNSIFSNEFKLIGSLTWGARISGELCSNNFWEFYEIIKNSTFCYFRTIQFIWCLSGSSKAAGVSRLASLTQPVFTVPVLRVTFLCKRMRHLKRRSAPWVTPSLGDSCVQWPALCCRMIWKVIQHRCNYVGRRAIHVSPPSRPARSPQG